MRRMATTAATRPKATAPNKGEADAIARLLDDRRRQGLAARVIDPVLLARVAAALKNGNGNGQSALASLKNGEKRRLARNIDARRLVN